MQESGAIKQNPSIVDTLGPEGTFLILKALLFQGLNMTLCILGQSMKNQLVQVAFVHVKGVSGLEGFHSNPLSQRRYMDQR